jgi:hypothetical protein
MLEMDQICLWVVGYPVHDEERNLCVPDWSCCRLELLAPREVREAYLAAYMGQFDAERRRAAEAKRRVERMNLAFLHAFVAGLGAFTGR